MTKPSKPKGRPSSYTAEVAEAICARLAEGESLNRICKDAGLPSEATVRMWALDDIDGFATKYARAREIGYDCLAEQILSLSDECRMGEKTVSKATGLEVTTGDMVERSRLQVEARKWLLSKMLPKRYGEKVDHNHSGAIDMSHTISFEDPKAE
jgi:hypothetical protein